MNKPVRIVLLLIAVIVIAFLSSRLAKPELPIDIAYRESLVGQGYVVRFTNLSDKYLQLKVKYINDTFKETKTDMIELQPHGTEEIGWLEGWKFSSGEKIFVSHSRYRTLRGIVP